MKEDINLLPKQIVIGRERRAYLFGFGRLLQRVAFLLVAIIVGEGVVYSAYYYVGRTMEKSWSVQVQSSSAIDEAQKINELLALADTARREFNGWSLYSEEVLNNAPSEIVISKLEVKEKIGALEIAGYASQRAAVLEYKNILSGLSWVERVESPLQNYAIGPDAGFSFSLIIDQGKL